MPQIAMESFDIIGIYFFFFRRQSNQKEALAESLEKKKLPIENLQRIAGIGILFYILLKKVPNK
jgi:hypothetical protein